jgi:hypothetical protein
MKKIIRLTETDLTRIVRRVIEEGGFQGIKNDLEHEGGLHDIGHKIGNEIYNFIETKNQFKAMLKGDSYEFNKSRVFKTIVFEMSRLYTKMTKLKKLISLFEEKDMKLTKSDLGDYGFDISDLLDELESHYNKVGELKDLASDDEVMEFLDGYENTINDIVELLDSISD